MFVEEAEPEVNEEPFVAPAGLAIPADVELVSHSKVKDEEQMMVLLKPPPHDRAPQHYNHWSRDRKNSQGHSQGHLDSAHFSSEMKTSLGSERFGDKMAASEGKF